MGYGVVKGSVRLCEQEAHGSPCFIIFCESCGDCGGHYNSISLAQAIAKAHERQPHQIKTDA